MSNTPLGKQIMKITKNVVNYSQTSPWCAFLNRFIENAQSEKREKSNPLITTSLINIAPVLH